MVRAAPTGNPSRRAWYLYETPDRAARLPWTMRRAGWPPSIFSNPNAYFTGTPRLSRRHRVRDNLLGTGRFCPVIRRTRR